MKIYLPNTSNCVRIINQNQIRVYDSVPTHYSNVTYTDYYINNHYFEITGTTYFGEYSDINVCQNLDITTDYFYRNDLPDILFIFSVFTIFCVIIPVYLISKIFKRSK